MKGKRWGIRAAAALAALLLMATMPLARAPVEGAATAGGANPRAVRRSVGAKGAGSARLQREADHVFYGHAVTRRIAAPEEILHADFRAAQAYYGEAWQLLSFSADALEMSREIDLFCPMHRVIGCNEAGEIVRSRNVYGDGMAIEKTCPLLLESLLPREQDQVRLGLGFDTAEEADAWAAAH